MVFTEVSHQIKEGLCAKDLQKKTNILYTIFTDLTKENELVETLKYTLIKDEFNFRLQNNLQNHKSVLYIVWSEKDQPKAIRRIPTKFKMFKRIDTPELCDLNEALFAAESLTYSKY